MNIKASVQEVQGSKESQMGWHKASKANILTSHEVEKGVYQAHQYHGGVSYKRLHPINP